jgi:hypothetical protein
MVSLMWKYVTYLWNLKRSTSIRDLYAIHGDELEAASEGYIRLPGGQWWSPDWH